MKVWCHTVKGRKPVNEDYLLNQNLGDGRYICLIADGMGGYSNGDLAAKLVAENILALVASHKHVDQSLLQIGVNKANLALRQLEQRTGKKSGTTIGGIYIESNKVTCFWIGDVKILYFRNNKLHFESKSHTLIDQLQDRGLHIDLNIISSHRHIITKSIQGDQVNPTCDFYSINVERGIDEIFICSDGYPHDQLISTSGIQLSNDYIKSFIELDSAMDDTSYYYISFSL